MKHIWVIVGASLLFSGTTLAAGAGSWAGPHVGVNAGWNHSELNNFSSEGAPTLGVELGWNIVVDNRIVVGPQLFYNWNQDKDRRVCYPAGGCTSASVGSRAYGLALLLGFPVGMNDDLMPYVRFGESRLQERGHLSGSGWVSWSLGGGLEWRLNRSIGLVFQYNYAKYGGNVDDWENSDLTFGVNFHF